MTSNSAATAAEERALSRVRTMEHAWIPMRDGTRLSARIWLPDDARRQPGPGHPRVPPVPAGRLDRRPRRASGTPTSPPTATPCGPGRPARLRQLRGRASPTSTPTGAAATACDVIAWLAGAAVVHGQRRHDRHLLGRVQLAPGRRARRPPRCGPSSRSAPATTGTPTTCTTSAARCSASTCSAGRDRCWPDHALPPDPGGSARLARAVGASGSSALGRSWTPGWRTSTATLLAARLRLRGLRRHRGARCSRSAAGPTATGTRCSGCWPACPCPREGAHRPLVARSTRTISAARAADRVPAGDAPVVGPLAARRSTTASWPSRCCAPGCRSQCRPRPHHHDAAGPLGGRAVLAAGRRPGPAAVPRRRRRRPAVGSAR